MGSFIIVLLGCLPFAFLGLAVSYLVRSDSATSVASALILLFAFMGNLFVPLSGKLLVFSRYTPMWGYITLARWPITEGEWTSANGEAYTDELWKAGLAFAVWSLLFIVLAIVALRRQGERQ